MFRPLSPHIFIYQPQLSSLFSVLHRITGTILALSVLFSIILYKFVTLHISFYFLYSFAFLLNTYFSWLLISVIVLFVYALCYHMSNGIRHLLWDFSSNPFYLQKKTLTISAYIVVFFTLFLGSLVFVMLM